MTRWWNDVTVFRAEVDDKQAHKVYRMERDIMGWHKDTVCNPETMEQMVLDGCRHFSVKKIPAVTYVDRPRWTTIGQYEDNTITLNKGRHGSNFSTLIHELAHHITDELYSDVDVDAHGPEWAWVYIELLDKFKMLPRSVAETMFRAYGVRL